MSHVISMHRPDDPRQTPGSDLSKIILCLLALRFEESTFVVRAKQHNHSAIAALRRHISRTTIVHLNRYNQLFDCLSTDCRV